MNPQYDAVGAHFNSESFHHSRTLTQDALRLFAEQIRSGMTCRESIKLCNSIMTSLGATKLWHQTFVRFGKNTILGYEDPLELDAVLGESDIVTVDVGPVFYGHEGDGGTTIVMGHNDEYLRIVQDVKKFFPKLNWHGANKNSAERNYMLSQARWLLRWVGDRFQTMSVATVSPIFRIAFTGKVTLHPAMPHHLPIAGSLKFKSPTLSSGSAHSTKMFSLPRRKSKNSTHACNQLIHIHLRCISRSASGCSFWKAF